MIQFTALWMESCYLVFQAAKLEVVPPLAPHDGLKCYIYS